MRDFTHNRSDAYQPLLIEIAFSPDTLSEIFNHREIYCSTEYSLKNDLRLDLLDQLKEAFWNVVQQLTPRQRQIITLYFKEEYTQTEVAKILGVNQSSVTKSINGNVDYAKNVGKSKRISYGGSKKRLKKLVSQDPIIQNLLKKLEELNEDE